MRFNRFPFFLSCLLALAGCAGKGASHATTSAAPDNFEQARQQQEQLIAQATGNAPSSGGFGSAFRKKSSRATSPAARQRSEPVNDPVKLAGKSTPVGAELFVASARLQESQGNRAAAVMQYERALAAEENNLAAMLGLARLYDRSGDFDKASAAYHKCLTAHPQNAMVHNDYGLCLARNRQFEKSISSMQKATTLDSQNALYRNNLAAVLVEANRSDEAYQELARVHRPAIAHYNLGMLLTRRNEASAAANHFAQAIQAEPGMTAAREMLDRTQFMEERSPPQIVAESTLGQRDIYLASRPAIETQGKTALSAEHQAKTARFTITPRASHSPAETPPLPEEIPLPQLLPPVQRQQ